MTHDPWPAVHLYQGSSDDTTLYTGDKYQPCAIKLNFYQIFSCPFNVVLSVKLSSTLHMQFQLLVGLLLFDFKTSDDSILLNTLTAADNIFMGQWVMNSDPWPTWPIQYWRPIWLADPLSSLTVWKWKQAINSCNGEREAGSKVSCLVDEIDTETLGRYWDQNINIVTIWPCKKCHGYNYFVQNVSTINGHSKSKHENWSRT